MHAYIRTLILNSSHHSPWFQAWQAECKASQDQQDGDDLGRSVV